MYVDLFLPVNGGNAYLFANDGTGSFQQVTDIAIVQDNLLARGVFGQILITMAI